MRSIIVIVLALSPFILSGDVPRPNAPRNTESVAEPGRFTFVRIEYDSVGGYGEAYYDYDGRFWHRWETDYPEAEENFLYRIEELTTMKVNPIPISLRLTDEALFDYPFIYMCDVGWQILSRDEEKRLRDYLLRGGFLWIDDFWGDAEWDNFEFNMKAIFPALAWREISLKHPILSMVFPLKECPQIPAKIFWDSGWPHDPPYGHREPTGGIPGVRELHFRGLFDTDGRLMAVATHNSDIGDGWEREAESRDYFENFSTRSYAMGVNIVVYALTH